MGRIYHAPVPKRPYMNYNNPTLNEALCSVRRGKLSQRKAGTKYGIVHSTLSNKVNGRHTGKVGGQQKISAVWESEIANCINTLVDFRVPLTRPEVCGFVKSYIDAASREEGLDRLIFANDNLPGIDWLRGFMKRNDMTLRKANNVKASRANVSADSLNSYFENLEKELEGIPPSNIFNYDETNLSDDPGNPQVVCRRGLNRVERLMEHSHSSTSIMFCGSADGSYLAPFVVYKVQSGNLYSEWIKGGPKGAHYDSTKSGWFDKRTFREWFFSTILPLRAILVGPIAIIGDNLGSHFEIDVIRACQDNDIRFITMPPNSTHLCQPLDLAVFRTVKIEWRSILDTWRKSTRLTGLIPKKQIPALVEKLWRTLNTTHLVSGFKGSGIYPLDRSQVLKRLSGSKAPKIDTALPSASLKDICIDFMKKRTGPPKAKKRLKRGFKLTHGQAIVISEEDWTENHCSKCDQKYVKDSDRVWVGCDRCEKWYHLECSGLDFDEDDDLELENIEFECKDH